LANVWKRKKGELIASTTLATIFIVISACIVYLAENGAQPDKYSNIPESIYWSAITISSVGYGDIYPITFLGKLFTIVIALIGVGMIALPAGIFASGFIEEHTKNETKNYCPHCGKKL
jgi:voltage-gated potassium channel